MEPITVRVLIDHAPDIKGEFLGLTSYNLYGQGDFNSVKKSAESVIVNYLDCFSRLGQPVPQPHEDLPVTGFQLEERVERHYDGLPPLIFEFYRRPQNQEKIY